MFNRYYQKELAYLKELAVEFAKAHPALAPALGDQTTDPDVERLLEGVAFSTGLLRQKLDDEFPEIIHGLMGLIFPHYLRPLPSASIIAFTPKPGLQESLIVPKGTTVASVPVDGTQCVFQTCYDVRAEPLRLLDARLIEQAGAGVRIQLSLELNAGALSNWGIDRLRFYIGGDYTDASDLYLLLNRFVKSIQIQPREGGDGCLLPAECLKPVGFEVKEDLVPYPDHAFQGYRYPQEYFLLPQKFLFFDLTGLEQWRSRGNSSIFDIMFDLGNPPFYPSQVRPENFVLFATPVINIFDHAADPILIDHHQPEYYIRPSGKNVKHYQVFSIESVTGIVHGMLKHKEYVPVTQFSDSSGGRPIYQVMRRLSIIDQEVRVFLTLPYSDHSRAPEKETLSLKLLCTNGSLPENLQLGDIRQPTSESPILLSFKNIIPLTTPVQPPLGNNTLWLLLSHLSLNFLPLANKENLKELLYLYCYPYGRDSAKIAANRKRIDGILDIKVKASDRLVRQYMMRGHEIELEMRKDHFAGTGDMYLFAMILDYFMGVFAGLNTFTRLHLIETLAGDRYEWEPRLGTTPML